MAEERDDAAVVYRYLRDHGESTLSVIAEACFPTSLQGQGPASTLRHLKRRSVRRTLGSLEWMRSQGVALTCLSHPGLPSGFVLGVVLQDPLTAIGYVARDRVTVTADRVLVNEMSDISSDQTTGLGDLMGLWHEGN